MVNLWSLESGVMVLMEVYDGSLYDAARAMLDHWNEVTDGPQVFVLLDGGAAVTMTRPGHDAELAVVVWPLGQAETFRCHYVRHGAGIQCQVLPV